MGLISGSLAVLTSALDSLLDILSSSINYVMIRQADKPPDQEHPFGHGKLEAYASFLQSVIIFATGGFLLYQAIKKINTPQLPVVDITTGLVMVMAISASLFITVMLKRVAKQENSLVLESDAAHYSIDLLSNSGVLLTIILIKFTGIMWIDPLVAGILAIYIMISAIRLHMSAFKIMLDSKVSNEQFNEINRYLHEFSPYQHGFHRLRTRTDGTIIFADVHLTLCGKLALKEVHALCDLIETRISEGNKGVDIVIHPEPCSKGICLTPECDRENVLKLLKQHGIIPLEEQ